MGTIKSQPATAPIKPAAAPPVQPQTKDRETLTEKFFQTEVGGFYKDAPMLSGVATTVGLLGTGGLISRSDALSDIVFNEKTAGLLVGAGGALLLEEGIDDLRNGKQMAGVIKTSLGSVGTLGGAELLTGARVLTKPLEIVAKNGYAAGGTAAAVGSAYLVKDALSDIKNGDTVRGGLKAAAGGVGALGATELMGRQFGKSLIVDPMVKLAHTKGAQYIGAGAGAVAGAGLVYDGAKRLQEQGSVLNDALGVAEVTGGALLATGSTSLAGVAMGSEKLTQIMPKSAKSIGAAALAGTAYTLGRETVKSAKEDGLTYLNAATGTGAALSALGAAEMLGASGAFTKGGQFAGALGVGAASGLLANSALKDIKDGNYGEGSLKGAGAVLGFGSAMALANVPGVREVGEAVVEGAWENVIGPTVEFAVEQPLVSIPLAIGGAYAAYKLMDKGEKETPEAKTLPEGGTPLSATQGVGTKIDE